MIFNKKLVAIIAGIVVLVAAAGVAFYLMKNAQGGSANGAAGDDELNNYMDEVYHLSLLDNEGNCPVGRIDEVLALLDEDLPEGFRLDYLEAYWDGLSITIIAPEDSVETSSTGASTVATKVGDDLGKMDLLSNIKVSESAENGVYTLDIECQYASQDIERTEFEKYDMSQLEQIREDILAHYPTNVSHEDCVAFTEKIKKYDPENFEVGDVEYEEADPIALSGAEDENGTGSVDDSIVPEIEAKYKLYAMPTGISFASSLDDLNNVIGYAKSLDNKVGIGQIDIEYNGEIDSYEGSMWFLVFYLER